jgi:hypothetical protein
LSLDLFCIVMAIRNQKNAAKKDWNKEAEKSSNQPERSRAEEEVE